MLNSKNLIAFSLLSLAVAAVPLTGARAFALGVTLLPYMEAQEDVLSSANSADVSTEYSDMTKKDCKALKKHKSDYSADEYKGRFDYCKRR